MTADRIAAPPRRSVPWVQRLWFAATLALFAIALGGSPERARAADWTVIGKVLGADTGEPISYATVALHKLASATDSTGTVIGGAMSMPDGTYRIAAAPGLYRLFVSQVGRRLRKSDVFEVKAGEQPLSLDFALISDVVQIKGVEVRSTVIRDTEQAILAKQKNAAAVSDGVGSEQISKSTDSNAAQVLQRVTGLSVVGGKYIYVRGLGERYSQTQVNGATIGTPEPNKRVVPLDIFAAGLLDNVVVQKTYTPDQPGEFGGGVVNVSTRDFPGHSIRDFSLSSGWNGRTTGKDFYGYDGGSTDALGFDDGTRRLSGTFNRLAKSKKITTWSPVTQKGFKAEEIATIQRSFSNTWDRTSRSAIPSTGFSGTLGNEFTVLGRQLGLIGSLSYSRGLETRKGDDRFYQSDQGVLFPSTSYRTVSSTESVLWGALGNASYRVNDFTTLWLRTMYNRSADNETRSYAGTNTDWNTEARNTRFDFVSRGIFAGSFTASSHLRRLNGANLDLKFAYSRADRDEPDRREYTYERRYSDGAEIWSLTTRNLDNGLTRMFGEMQEEERAPEVSLSVPFKQWSGLDAKVKTGFAYKNKDRDSRWRRFGYRAPSFSNAKLDSLLAQPAGSFMIDELLTGDPQTGFVLTELTKQDTDNYRGHANVSAYYLMGDIPLTHAVRVVTGARVEHAVMKVEAYDIFRETAAEQLAKAKLDNHDVLPSVNVTANLSEASNLRLAFSSTVSRPDFRELSNQNLYDFVGGYPEVGNPKLRRARIKNYDLRLETYPGASELAAVSFFYKDMDQPIERSVQGGSVVTYMPINAKSGFLRGGEAEVRVGLGRVTSKLTPLGVSLNYARIKSETNISGFGVDTKSRRPLQGQSSYVVNAGLFYANGDAKTTGSLLYNIAGRRLAGVGVYGLPDVYEQPRASLDFTMSHALRGAKLKLSVENLLDSEVRFEQHQAAIEGVTAAKELLTHSARYGRSVSLSVSSGL